MLITCSAIMLLVFVMRQKIDGISLLEPTISELSWDDYRASCGILAFLANPRESWMKFNKDYRYLNINWSGYIAKITVNANTHDSINDHSCGLFLKMVPDDFENAISLVVMFDKELYDLHKNTLMRAEIGQKVEFNATLIGMGTDRNLPHLHGLGVKLLNDKITITEELTSFGRYGPAEGNS